MRNEISAQDLELSGETSNLGSKKTCVLPLKKENRQHDLDLNASAETRQPATARAARNKPECPNAGSTLPRMILLSRSRQLTRRQIAPARQVAPCIKTNLRCRWNFPKKNWKRSGLRGGWNISRRNRGTTIF